MRGRLTGRGLTGRGAGDPRVAELLGEHGRRERLLAWGELSDGQIVACTREALHVPEVGRLAWDQVIRAGWSEEFLDLVYQAQPGAGRAEVRLRFEAPGNVPAVVRERVEWTVLASHAVTLRHPDGRTAQAVLNARRSPESGEVRWAVVFGADADPSDEQWRAAADEALAEVRDQLGI